MTPRGIRETLGSALLFVLFVAAAQAQQEVRIGVLGLFHPKQLVLEQASSQVIAVASREGAWVLNGEPGHRRMLFQADADQVFIEGSARVRDEGGDGARREVTSWTATARGGGAVAFQLTIPGRITRRYRGTLTILARKGELLAVVAMDRETAVASIVGAEMMPQSPMEALKAQAVVTRSFLEAGGRHKEYEFCDTTHCQFLRSPPDRKSKVWRAVTDTRGMVLEYRSKPLAAMYSSRCGGQTHSLQEVGMRPGAGYPYYAATCPYCRRHSLQWETHIGDSGRLPESGNEGSRILQARQWGWSAIPGSNFTATRVDSGWSLQGHSIGHGIGMCQFGAAGMAASGMTFRDILRQFYPNTEIVTLP
jgi:peptidoglycan hydrolase-like amidase